jgi:hypothetical protein
MTGVSGNGRECRFNCWSMNSLCDSDFWLERIPQLLGLSVTLEAVPGGRRRLFNGHSGA